MDVYMNVLYHKRYTMKQYKYSVFVYDIAYKECSSEAVQIKFFFSFLD